MISIISATSGLWLGQWSYPQRRTSNPNQHGAMGISNDVAQNLHMNIDNQNRYKNYTCFTYFHTLPSLRQQLVAQSSGNLQHLKHLLQHLHQSTNQPISTVSCVFEKMKLPMSTTPSRTLKALLTVASCILGSPGVSIRMSQDIMSF